MKKINIIISLIFLVVLSVIILIVIDGKKINSDFSHDKSNNNVQEDLKKDKINIYLFWGDGCNACRNLKSYFKQLDNEIGDYYNLILYEVWSNEDNKQLMNKVNEYLKNTNNAVPYLIIGDESIIGFNDSYKDYIKSKIIEEYNKGTNFDIMDKIKSED